jgi:penicillin amidase
MGQGRVAEFFGTKGLSVDKFMHTIGFYDLTVQSMQYVDSDSLSMIDAYVAGVNDYIDSAAILPLEFWIFGMSREHFSREDVLVQGRIISFHLSWNWNYDLAREAIREGHPDLADMVEELIPFSTEFLAKLVTSVDDDDLKLWGQYSDETLQERYTKAKETMSRASPPLDPEISKWQDSIRARAELK